MESTDIMTPTTAELKLPQPAAARLSTDLVRPSERIIRMRRRYQEETPVISIQRARHFTEKWRELEGSGVSPVMRTAQAMRHMFENVEHHIDPDDRVAGCWTEFFLGVPVDVERGLFNQVLETELEKGSMLRFQARSYLKFGKYLLLRQGPSGILRNLRMLRQVGPTPVNLGLTTMQERQVNPFTIRPHDLKVLKRDLLPWWRGRTMADRVEAAIDRAGLRKPVISEFADSIPNTPSKQAIIVSLAAAVATYQGHLVLDQEKVLKVGLEGIRLEIEAKLAEPGQSDPEKQDFYQALLITLDGIQAWSTRLVEALDRQIAGARSEERREQLQTMREACRNVPWKPARTFREALQSLWITRTALELAHVTNVHSFGRLDQLLNPYYTRDLAQGLISREEARELLEEVLLKVMTQNLRPESNFLGRFYLRYEGSTPVTLGGLTRDGDDATNDLTELLLEAAERSKSVTSIVVRVHEKTPQKLYMKVAEILHRGTSSLSLMNDEVFVSAMEKQGFLTPDARDYAITGCTDALCPGKTGGISFTGLLLSRILDLTLRRGDALTMLGLVKGVGEKTPAPETFRSFEELLDAFTVQAEAMIKLCADASNVRDQVFAEHMPAPAISLFLDGCIESGTDVTRGGARYNFSGINMINSLANVVDSLYVIRKLVFEQGTLSLPRLISAMDNNFQGYDDVHRAIQAVSGKWGNGNPESDDLAREISERLFHATASHQAFKGGSFVPFINSMTSHTLDGRVATATPDGRKAATPYAASCNPYNVEKGGLTGVLTSVAALDFTRILGCAVNVRLHPSAVGRTPEARKKWTDLMKTYFLMGGAQIQPTIASAEELRQAQEIPDEYRDLIVKVGGYSTYFVDLGKEIQDEIISRTEHGV